MVLIYQQNRREAEENDEFDGNRIRLSFECDRSVAAEKSSLHVADEELDENKTGGGWSEANKQFDISCTRHQAGVDLPSKNRNRSSVMVKARASWKHGGFPFGFIALLMC